MPNYKKMYFKLFAACTDVLEAMQQVTQETEQMAMEEESEPLALPGGKPGKH